MRRSEARAMRRSEARAVRPSGATAARPFTPTVSRRAMPGRMDGRRLAVPLVGVALVAGATTAVAFAFFDTSRTAGNAVLPGIVWFLPQTAEYSGPRLPPDPAAQARASQRAALMQQLKANWTGVLGALILVVGIAFATGLGVWMAHLSGAGAATAHHDSWAGFIVRLVIAGALDRKSVV